LSITIPLWQPLVKLLYQPVKSYNRKTETDMICEIVYEQSCSGSTHRVNNYLCQY